ncbi:hypoxanthine phosphoribosyltransferase [Cuneatibacter sp. NSJ-177]|uniref:hypoxanthine phosphoribosyltransferase n=1 Tax=Cuneatibacter sp. NSJ-177 TaxID=2931401 RepID=UPI001FD0AD20|nr:hypoxanthine phosphoribosyltransferase [Cuneatibacter sp. NSJ-177]MCJ7836629.1 hypoxanthine phosphoribosyltransferase [Cuneatibacter sp. NSJ-177]
MENEIRVLIPEDEVDRRIAEIAAEISRDYAGKSVHLLCILKGSVFFTCELAKRLTVPVTLDFMSCSSYGSGTISKGIVRLVKDLDEPIEGRDVIIVEDIIDSGNTLSYLVELMKARKPASLKLCTLLDKPSRRVHHEVKVDYTCFSIEDLFVVGYGLDYDQHYRNLPYIGVIENE